MKKILPINQRKQIMKNSVPDRVESFFQEVKNSPFLKGYADQVDHFADLPVLDREKLKEMVDENFDLHAETRGVYLSRTGGTLNETLMLPNDHDEHLQQLDLVSRVFKGYGSIEPGDVVLNLMHYQNMYRSASQADDIIRFADATSIGLSASVPDNFIYDYIKKFKPNSIAGTPSRVLQFANWVHENKREVHISKFLYGGEALSRHQYHAVREYLHVKEIYTMFGSTEIGPWGSGKYQDAGFLFEVTPELVYLEIDDPDEDGYGAAVITNICKKRFPVLRYKTDDVGRIQEKNGVQYFEFKERGEYTFRLHGTIYSERNFFRVTAEAEYYQIHLDYDERKHTVLIIKMVQQDLGMSEEDFIREKEELLEEIIPVDSNILAKHVKLVDVSELKTNESTSKTPLVVDHRLNK